MCSASDESGSPRNAWTVSVCRKSQQEDSHGYYLPGKGEAEIAYLSADVVEKGTEHIGLHREYVR